MTRQPLTHDEELRLYAIGVRIRMLAETSLWDRPSTPSDYLRKAAFVRAHTFIFGARMLNWTVVPTVVGPVVITPDHGAQPLYFPRGGA